MIRLQFVSGHDIGSEAIKIFSRGWPSHVDAILEDGTLLGARLDGIKIRPPNYEVFDRREVILLEASLAVEARYLGFLGAQIGKPYDRTAIAAFAFERDWQDEDSWFCSELIAAALVDSGWFPKTPSDPSNEITPRDLLLMVSPFRLDEVTP